MIKLIENTMPVMDAVKFNGEFDEGTTVAEVVNWVLENFPNDHGEIILIDSNDIDDRVSYHYYTRGDIEKAYLEDCEEDAERYIVKSLNAIKWGMTMSLTIEIGYSKED